MWTNLNPFCYEPLLLNFYHSPLPFPFPLHSYQTFPQINNSLQNQQSPCNAQKSYRETVEEIEQIVPKKTRNSHRKKVEKSRIIIKKEKEDNFERKKQKKDRNLPSNICKYFVSYLYHHPRPASILQTPNAPQNSLPLDSCISKMKNHIKDNQTYIRPGLIESMCRSSLLGEEEAAMVRILFKKFIKTEFRIIISMMRKLTKKEKVAYFKMGRKFLKKFTTSI